MRWLHNHTAQTRSQVRDRLLRLLWCISLIAIPTVTDAQPAAAATLTLTPATLQYGHVGVPYSEIVTASGGTSPYRFSISTGSLPPGLNLTSGGPDVAVLNGTPSEHGEFAFTIEAVDVHGTEVTAAIDLDIGFFNTTTTLVSSGTTTYGQTVSFTATVTPSGVTGAVQFRDGGAALGAPVALSSRVATLSTSALALGTHTMTAEYLGVYGYNPSTGSVFHTVGLGTQTITFANPGTHGNGTTFGAVATTTAAGLDVTFTSTTATICTTSGANGATVTNLAPGTCTLIASQPGNANYAAAAPVPRASASPRPRRPQSCHRPRRAVPAAPRSP
jgi:hypothetical protein